MTSSITVQLSGLDEILRNVDSIQKLEGLQAAMLAGATHMKSRVDRYPPASEANNPSNQRWYERGYGPHWRRRDGSMGGRKTSEMLNREWTVATRGPSEVVLGTNVSYSPYVMDADHQAWFHKARGWKTIQQVAKDETPTVIKFISDYMRRKFGMT